MLERTRQRSSNNKYLNTSQSSSHRLASTPAFGNHHPQLVRGRQRKMDSDECPQTLSTTNSGSFSESEDSITPSSTRSLDRSQRGVASPSNGSDPKRNVGGMSRKVVPVGDNGGASTDKKIDDRVVVVDIPPNLPLLMTPMEEPDSSNKVGLWSIRTRAALRRSRQQQRRLQLFSWDEDNLSSAAVWSESLGNVGTGLGSSCETKLVAPNRPSIGVSSENRRRSLRFLRSLPRFLRRSKTTRQASGASGKREHCKHEERPRNAPAEPSSIVSPHSSTLPSRKHITQERRARLGFARTIAMDGILESFPEERLDGHPDEDSNYSGRTPVSTSVRNERTQVPLVKGSSAMDYSRILKEESPRNSPLHLSSYVDHQRRDDAPSVLVWV